MFGITIFYKSTFLSTFLSLIAFLILSAPATVRAQEEGRIYIQLKYSQLSVDIQEAKLVDVIAKLKERTGIDFRFDSLPDESVNIKFDGLSLRESIERLIPLSTVILLDGDSIGSVMILSSSSSSALTPSDTEQADNFTASASTSTVKSSLTVMEQRVASSPSASKAPNFKESSSVIAHESDARIPPVSIVVPKPSSVIAKQKDSYPGFFTFFGDGSPETQPLDSDSDSSLDTESSPVVAGQSGASPPPVSNSATQSPPVVAQQNNTSSPPVSASVPASSSVVAGQGSVSLAEIAAFGTGFSKAQSLVEFGSAFAVAFPPGNSKTGAPLSVSDINTIVSQTANSLDSTTMVIAVVDRQGTILGLFRKSGGLIANQDAAVALARTAAFFSHKQAVLTSRTVRFISGEHFPPGISFTPNGALFGIEHNNRGCDFSVSFNAGQSFPQSLAAAGGTCNSTTQTGCGLGSLTIPGSFPLYKGNDLVGAVGVFGIGPALTADPQGGLRKLAVGYEAEEFAALQGAVGFEPPQFSGGGIFIDGIRLPGVVQTVRPAGFSADPGGFAGGTFDTGPTAGTSAGSTSVPSGFLVGPTAGGSLTLADVNTIIQQSRDAANRIRAAIRLPFTETARMVIAVGDLNGNILAVFRQSDSTIFSIDVAITKARNVAYFSGSAVAAQDKVGLPDGTAITNRTISFGSQRFFPAGIDFAGPGPFRDVFLNDAANSCSQGRQAVNANQSGIVFFPGSVPLYKNGVLVGGLGVSGDGVEQDDFVTASGAKGFEPPSGIRADQFKINAARMPYLKFPRNPTNLGTD